MGLFWESSMQVMTKGLRSMCVLISAWLSQWLETMSLSSSLLSQAIASQTKQSL